MTEFEGSSEIYDRLYRDKDYEGEAAFVDGLLRSHAATGGSLLDLGCGSGVHAALLAAKGWSVHGVDRSPGMLARAEARRSCLPKEVADRLDFATGDVRSYRTDRRFDSATALFHVVGYQTTADDLRAAFATAHGHLTPGGLFLFDYWYGPAVLSTGPSVRVKRIDDGGPPLLRIAEPTLLPDENVVEVRYSWFAGEEEGGLFRESRELHRMRYLFTTEVTGLCAEAGFDPLFFGEWMTGRPPGVDTWSVYCVAKAIRR